MEFLRRLKFYLIGVGLGILLVLAIFKDRKLTAWMPENQVKKELSENEIQYSAEIKCRLICHGIVDEDDLDSLLEQGDIDFGESDVKDFKSRLYLIKFEDGTVESITLTVGDSVVVLEEVSPVPGGCPCD